MKGPGVEIPRIKELDDLAAEYQKEKQKRCQQTPKEIAAKGKLIDAIHKHADKLGRTEDGAVVYKNDELKVTLKPGKEKLNVKPVDDDNNEGEED
jgi:hypothetical protein